MSTNNIIETKRLILRPWREDDAADLYKYACDERIGPDAGWPVHKDEQDSLNVLRTVLIKENTWAITIKGSDEPVGSIGYFPGDATRANGEPEIGYWIAVPFWGNGYIPEATQAVIDRCFNEGANQVWCAHFIENLKSRKVIEKCGFVYQFTEPWSRGSESHDETLYYCISREAWENDRV